MLKAEKLVIQFIEKHLYLLMVLLVSAMALFLRRPAVWWNSPDVGAYFDGHANHTQSSLYYVLVSLIQHLPLLPLHSLKWIMGLADFAAATLCVVAAERKETVAGRKETAAGSQTKDALKSVVFYTVLIMSPVAYLRGILWAQPDVLAFVCILGAYLLWGKGKKALAVLAAVPGVTVYPAFFLLILGYLWFSDKGVRGKNWIYLGSLAAGFILLQGLCSLILGNTWKEGIMTCFRWTAYEPYGGKLFEDGLAWVKQMVNVCGYGAAMVSLLLAYKRRVSYIVPLMIHMAVLLVYGSFLFPAAL